MPTLQQIIKEWDEKFPEMYQDLRIEKKGKVTWVDIYKEIKSFIHSRDKAILEGVKEMVENLKMDGETESGRYYNYAIEDIIILINKELE